MPIHHAVLGLLADGPSYGYELKANFEDAIGPQWGELNIGHVYQVLERLVRDGLVTHRVILQHRKPDRVVYRLTKRGRQELDSWLTAPATRSSGYRDDFFLKLFVASRVGASRLRQTLSTQRREYLAELSSLSNLRTQRRGDPFVALLLDAAIYHTEASLKVVEQAERRIADIVSDASSRSTSRAAAEERRDRNRRTS